MACLLLSLAVLAPALRAYVPNAQKLPAPLLAGDQNLLFAAERGRLSGRKVEAVCAAYPRLAKLLAAESDEAHGLPRLSFIELPVLIAIDGSVDDK